MVGESVLDALSRLKFGEMDSQLCFGDDQIYQPHIRPHDPFSDGPVCGKCKIMLHDNWHKKVMTETDGYAKNEEMMLHFSLNAKSNTRLSCCVPVEAWMDGMSLSFDHEPEFGEEADLV